MQDNAVFDIKSGKTQPGFSTNFGVLLATLSSAIGLGNIWKVPYLTGVNGGAGFLAIYILATFLISMPVMIAEIMIGRYTKKDVVSTLKILTHNKHRAWNIISIMAVCSAALILGFYSEVGGWVFSYVEKSVTGGLALAWHPGGSAFVFSALIHSPWQSLFWQWVVLLASGAILWFGVTKGIEAIAKKLMPVLLVLLLIMCGFSLTLPGASSGVAFLLMPDFSKISIATILTALGLAFFKLAICTGGMITYGSYYRDDQNIPATVVRVMCADLVVSILAGLVIFPAVFASGLRPTDGASLLFVTIPQVFKVMPFGSILMPLFFLLAAIAALCAMISILEVLVAVFAGYFKLGRPKAIVASIVLSVILGAGCALSNSTLADFTVFGRNFFDFFDFITSNLLMPLGGILMCFFIRFIWGRARWLDSLSNHQTITNRRSLSVLYFVLTYLTPIIILLVIIGSLVK